MVQMPPRATWVWLVEAALAEDLGPGDATSEALLPPDLSSSARVEARQPLVVAGLEVAAEVFERCGADWEGHCPDGADAGAGDLLATVRGSARALLAAERTALNFLQRLSGVATLTRRFTDAVRDTRAEIIDTRKTTPGWRYLEKYAVRCGGGGNHRLGLYDGILIKDNHIAAVGGVADAVKHATIDGPRQLKIRVEVESLDQARAAIDAGADALLVDNQTPDAIASIVKLAAGRVRIEASGGITLDCVAAIARTGVDEISVGALTHSAPAVDIALEWNPVSSS